MQFFDNFYVVFIFNLSCLFFVINDYVFCYDDGNFLIVKEGIGRLVVIVQLYKVDISIGIKIELFLYFIQESFVVNNFVDQIIFQGCFGVDFSVCIGYCIKVFYGYIMGGVYIFQYQVVYFIQKCVSLFMVFW